MITVTMRLADTSGKSRAVDKADTFVIATGFAGNIRAIQSEPDVHRAQRARDILAAHEERCGRDPAAIRMFRMQDIIWIEGEDE